MRAKLRLKGDSKSISFEDWEWGDFEALNFVINKQINELISERVSEVMREELAKEEPYVVMDCFNKDSPLEVTVAWPFREDVFFGATLRDMMVDYVEMFRPGGEGSGYAITEDDERKEIEKAVAELRQIADDMLKLCEGTK
jgi:hypothetical protein